MVKSYEEKLAILTEWFPSLEIPPRATAWLSRPDVSVEMVAECLVVNPPVDFFPPRPLKFPRAAIIDSKADPLFAEQPQHDEIVGQQDLSEWHSWRELQAADYFDFDFCLSEPCSPDYIKQSQQLVTGEQPQIQAGAIRFIMRSFRFRYAPSSKALDDAVERFLKAEKIISLDAKKRQTIVLSVSLPSGLKQEFQVEILSKPRSSRSDFNHVCPELLKEIQWLRYRESVAECHVCYNLVPTQQLIVCVDGHSFCPGCLRSQAKEALFGGGKVGEIPQNRSFSILTLYQTTLNILEVSHLP